jgi:ferredoxin-fold anticodon binding domain-containing protein
MGNNCEAWKKSDTEQRKPIDRAFKVVSNNITLNSSILKRSISLHLRKAIIHSVNVVSGPTISKRASAHLVHRIRDCHLLIKIADDRRAALCIISVLLAHIWISD